MACGLQVATRRTNRKERPSSSNNLFHEWKVASLGKLPEAKEEQAALWASGHPE